MEGRATRLTGVGGGRPPWGVGRWCVIGGSVLDVRDSLILAQLGRDITRDDRDTSRLDLVVAFALSFLYGPALQHRHGRAPLTRCEHGERMFA